MNKLWLVAQRREPSRAPSSPPPSPRHTNRGRERVEAKTAHFHLASPAQQRAEDERRRVARHEQRDGLVRPATIAANRVIRAVIEGQHYARPIDAKSERGAGAIHVASAHLTTQPDATLLEPAASIVALHA